MNITNLVNALKPITSSKIFKYAALPTVAAIGIGALVKSFVSRDVSLNVNGDIFTLQDGMDIKNIKTKEYQAIASIFDVNNNGLLDMSELCAARNDKNGLFTTNKNTDRTLVNFKSNEWNANWELNDNMLCLGSNYDLDNDGNIDVHKSYKYDKNGKISERTEEQFKYENNQLVKKESVTFFDNDNKDKSITEEYKNGQLVKKRYVTQIYDKEQCFSKTINYEDKDENGKPIVSFGLSNFSNFALMEKALKEAFGEKIMEEDT